MMPPPLRPRDFVETADGLLGAVTSLVHAEGPVVTPRYERTGQGLRKLETAEAARLVAARHPHWLVRSPLLDLEVVLVPLRQVVRVHRPDARLADLRAGGAGSAVERLAADAAAALANLGVPAGRMGVTGSLLVGAAGPDSDIDLVLYGRDAFHRSREALAALQARGDWGTLGAAHWRAAWERRGSPGTLDEYRASEERKRTKALVDGHRLDLTLLQDPGEGRPERPPYRKLARLELEALVLDDEAAFDLPARYGIAHEVPELVSWTATYAGQARAGERVRAAGWLEEDADGRRRLLVGTSREAPGEAIRVLPA